MCLLALIWRVHPVWPLVVAANRDEWLARPATAMQVLEPASPRILGGRDHVAGGTWLAANQHGLVAGLTNRPARQGRDPARRSRGALPLLLASHDTARAAAAAFARDVRAPDYNPCWILAGDRASLFYIDLTGDSVSVEELAPGVHVLENRPLHAESPKADAVRAALAPLVAAATPTDGPAAILSGLQAILRDHTVPAAARAVAAAAPTSAAGAGAGDGEAPFVRPLETEAPCVHAGPYGTRSSAILLVGPGQEAPIVHFTDGPPCTSPWSDATSLWRS